MGVTPPAWVVLGCTVKTNCVAGAGIIVKALLVACVNDPDAATNV
jgi:hypothetical protein